MHLVTLLMTGSFRIEITSITSNRPSNNVRTIFVSVFSLSLCLNPTLSLSHTLFLHYSPSPSLSFSLSLSLTHTLPPSLYLLLPLSPSCILTLLKMIIWGSAKRAEWDKTCKGQKTIYKHQKNPQTSFQEILLLLYLKNENLLKQIWNFFTT